MFAVLNRTLWLADPAGGGSAGISDGESAIMIGESTHFRDEPLLQALYAREPRQRRGWEARWFTSHIAERRARPGGYRAGSCGLVALNMC